MDYTKAQRDRALGSVLAAAVGDALGSAYEFGPSYPDSWRPTFGRGVFGHGVGEWTDDTAMALPILEWAAAHGSLSKRFILTRWMLWSQDAKDVGAQTRTVLQQLRFEDQDLTGTALQVSRKLHEKTGRTAGNGALMRIGPFALADLSPSVKEKLLREFVQWTHWDEDNVIACRLWVELIERAILTGELQFGFSMMAAGISTDPRWIKILAEATAPGVRARDFETKNGWVVGALQGALASLVSTRSLPEALEEAIRGGGDTDTVAAITGALAGAIYGADALPEEWVSRIHGDPGYTVQDLKRFTLQAIS